LAGILFYRGVTLMGSSNEDSKEGAKSFIEKRKPIFTGKWLE
jgi:hypothetical protein